MNPSVLWMRYQERLCVCRELGLTLDVSRMDFGPRFFHRMAGPLQRAYEAMQALERGAIANPDEGRQVGHYWLRDSRQAPRRYRAMIDRTVAAVKRFARGVHHGKKGHRPPSGGKFTDALIIGIGGSALGPQLVADALAGLNSRPGLALQFLDNTDPDGIRRTLKGLKGKLASTLVVVISKSGGTPETRNGMIETMRAFRRAKLNFARHAVAITQLDKKDDDPKRYKSKLCQQAKDGKWLKCFPMWDWVGGRTSVTSAVGLLPAALAGLDIDALLEGARRMDRLTRRPDVWRPSASRRPTNPAALLALAWHHATRGRGEKDMVVLPYKDRLLLFSRYLQQLIMESLGKERDLDGAVVNQGIAVYGNKGSTDQHAYVQQLRDGVANFFVTFLVVLEDVAGQPGARQADVHEKFAGITPGDYLHGFWLGTRQALHEKGRQSVTISVRAMSPRTLGALIALYERAVGLYAALVNINAYHQPGVEAGKKAAEAVLVLQDAATKHLSAHRGKAFTPDNLAQAIGQPDSAETLLHVLEHLAANQRVTKKGDAYVLA